tara:strand:- start:9604 stop:9804 length:201 start_codon:yes stop_codon:yes gene_type:complete
LTLCKNDLEATFNQLLAKYFGFKVNAVPFELLANSIDFNLLRKHLNNEVQLLALFLVKQVFCKKSF